MVGTDPRYIEKIEQDLAYHARLQAVLQEIAEKLMRMTGRAYFEALTKSIGEVLHVDHVLVTRQLNGALVVPISAHTHGEPQQCPPTLNVSGRPCEDVLETGRSVSIANGAQAVFGEDTSNAYLGMPLRNIQGDVVGHLAIGNHESFDDILLYHQALKFLAVQAAAELEHMRLQKEILTSLTNFEIMFETSPLGMAINDANGQLIDVNPAFCNILHFSREELRKLTVADILHPDDLELVLLFHTDLVDGRYVHFHVEKRFLGKKNRMVWCEATAFALRDSDGNYLQTVSFIEDITERRRAYALLERRVDERTEEIERRRQIAESLRDIIASVNQERNLDSILMTIVNKASDLLGCDSCALYRMSQAAFEVFEANQKVQSDTILGQPIVQEAIAKQGTMIITDLSSSLGTEYQCMVALPLYVEEQNYGCLALYYLEKQLFSKETVMLAESYANQAALAIENAQLKENARKLAASEERNRLARELHDAVSQTLWSASLLGEVLPSVWDRNPEQGRQQLEQLNQLTRVALAEMRALLLELRPDGLTNTSFRQLLTNLSESISFHSQLPITLHLTEEVKLPDSVQIAYYRIAQEALNNTVKHAQAKSVDIFVEQDATFVEMRIIDDGRGINLKQQPQGSFGLRIMHERALTVDADFRITSSISRGTEVVVRWERDAQAE